MIEYEDLDSNKLQRLKTDETTLVTPRTKEFLLSMGIGVAQNAGTGVINTQKVEQILADKEAGPVLKV